MNSSTLVFASFIVCLFCSLAFALSVNEEQKDLIDLENSEELIESYTGFQKVMISLIAASLAMFSVAGVFLIIDLVWRFK